MTPHINAPYNSYADIVLMPGDPLRAKHIAETFLTDVKQVNGVRNCLGYTGTYKDVEISVQASGMGQPSLSIYATELFTVYKVSRIIRIGTCGSFISDIEPGDIIVPMTASTDSSITKDYAPGYVFCPHACYQMLNRFVEESAFLNVAIGSITSNDTFYKEDALWYEKLANLGILGVDMETHALYALAMKHNACALTVNMVSDNLVTGESLSPEAREKGSNEMVEAVLRSLL